MHRGFLRQLPFQQGTLGIARLAAGSCEGMSLSDQYRCEIDQLKEKLKKSEREAEEKELAPRAGQPVYHPPAYPQPPSPSPFLPCPEGETRSQSPPYDCLKNVADIPSGYRPGRRPVKPGFTEEGPSAPISVATGGPPLPPAPPPPMPFSVPERAKEPCPSGYTRSQVPPYDCLPDVSSSDRYNPPVQQPVPQQMTTPTSESQGYYTPPSAGWGGGLLDLFGGGGISPIGLTGRAFLGPVPLRAPRG